MTRSLLVLPLILLPVAATWTPRGEAQVPVQERKARAIVRGSGSGTLDVALSGDGKLLARVGADRTIDVWDVASGRMLHDLKGHRVPILRVAFSPDGKTVASLGGWWLPDEVHGEVKLWDVATGRERVALKGHPARGFALAFSPDGKTLATSSGPFVKLWDVATGSERLEMNLGDQTCAWSLAFSPDGSTLAIGTGSGPLDIEPGSIVFWDAVTGRKKGQTARTHANAVTRIAFTPDGKTLAAANGHIDPTTRAMSGVIKLWKVADASEVATIPTRMAMYLESLDMVFTRDGKMLVSAMLSFDETGTSRGIAVQHWDVASRQSRLTYWAPGDFKWSTNAGIFFVALSRNGRRVAWVDRYDGAVSVWDVESLATQSAEGSAGLADLAGVYSLSRGGEGNYRIVKDGDGYSWSEREGGRWKAAIRTTVVTDAERAKLAAQGTAIVAGLHVRRGTSADQQCDVLRVPVGWKFQEFQSKTGYVLFSWFGPNDLYKVSQR